MATQPPIQFHRYTQSDALQLFPALLAPHLPLSNPIYNRLQSPLNTPSRHCLFAASFPPESLPSSLKPSSQENNDNSPASPSSEPFTILFTDRSRTTESQIWLFSSLLTHSTLTSSQTLTLKSQIKSAISFILTTAIPEAPGWPFSPILRFAAVHEPIAKLIQQIYGDAVEYLTWWNVWVLSIHTLKPTAVRGSLPEGYTTSRVPESQIHKVVSTSSIPRNPETLKRQANICILDPEKEMVAWAYIGVDGSLATLYVEPAYRGMGFAKVVARGLLRGAEGGMFADLGVRGSGWCHADVGEGNGGSEGVMGGLGARVGWRCAYLRVNGELVKD
ncbi:Acyl-CoA N-acyltransferases (Nat) [Glarea lozoyensis ATCC 20868]|uniref:Acyl-CoA N-acyltransferases (Nat) n=1 Tax=Glarea lozoyensis (strain ATCC 20868 / MF5171) TaxID=1116229 RepID=S3DTK0_GLAL2|nr:Acyl-CoA N-acyltransferases (Nat) [Glarea lozoyensis ATCC 20868]EPE29733.1 Acyl-CoA N-acyltransferases (Nat) [Glarea lozoyensis ATCC 20868]